MLPVDTPRVKRKQCERHRKGVGILPPLNRERNEGLKVTKEKNTRARFNWTPFRKQQGI
jgi:hypothetical protein